MDKLFITDLDGTLLNSKAEVSDFTKSELNRLIGAGVNFSFATARSAATCIKMFDGVNLQLPVILMNGVCIFDVKTSKYIKMYKIDFDTKKMLLEILKERELAGFIYSIDDDMLSVFYQNLNSPNAKNFMKERELKYGKYFTKVEDITECINRNIIYYSISDLKEKLDPIYELFKDKKSLHVEYYRDVYDTDAWYLEVFSADASKYNATKFLREKYDIKHIVSFGDNLNDIPLFKAADECYAVSNAKDDVKAFADDVIGANTEDAVVKKIAELYE